MLATTKQIFDICIEGGGGQRRSRRLSDNAPSHPIPKLGNIGRKNSKTVTNTDFLKTPESGMAG